MMVERPIPKGTECILFVDDEKPLLTGDVRAEHSKFLINVIHIGYDQFKLSNEISLIRQ
jgi:hypothetical protein